MDGSKPRKSDAATTRKRRSSILKSQRAPRTPFSELEFNVATPTDAKSRRVSFSRRNGVAEFEITEATTAWKNVYEEHNNALESSVNDADAKGERRPLVAHLSNRTGFMFEEFEADVIVASTRELVTSFNGLRDDTNDEGSLSAPRRQYDLSECTQQRTEQLFDNDANPTTKEMTAQIDLNFSAMLPMSELDLIQDRKSNRMSYIDADLNETHISLKGNDSEVSDMSITDTIHSPKVAAAKVKPDVDNWVADKENVVVNPYVAPLPAENFAVANDSDDVLIFDGKKCKFQSDLETDLPDVEASDQNKRKTIVYNDDDGDVSVTQAISAQILIPNDLNSTRKMNATVFESNISMTQAIPSNVIISNEQEIKQQTIYFNDLADITVTETVPSRALEVNKEQRRKTIVYEADEGHVSMTEAVPANIIVPERRKTILYQNYEGDISMTQAVPVNIIETNNPVSDKTKTNVYEADASKLEMTQAVPVNVLLTNKYEKRKTILFANDDGNMSITQAIPAHIMRPNDSRQEKNVDNISVNLTDFEVSLHEIKGQVKEVQDCIISDVTRLCSEAMSNVTEAEKKRKTIVFDDDEANVSITQAVPANILDPVPPVFNKSIDIAADITEIISTGLIIDSNKKNDTSLTRQSLADSGVAVPVLTEDIIVNNTALTEKERSNTSLTNGPPPDSGVAVPVLTEDIIVNNTALTEKERSNTSLTNGPPPDSGVAIPVVTEDIIVNNTDLTEKRRNDTCLTNGPPPDSGVAIPVAADDMSVNNTALTEKEPTLQLDHTAVTNSIETNDVPNECADKSITQVVSNKSVTISYDDSCNIPMSNPIPAHMMSIENDLADRTKEKLDNDMSEIYNVTLDKSKPGLQSIIVYDATIKLDKTDDFSEVQGAKTVTNEAIEPSPSDTSDPQEVIPEPMEEDNSSDSADSMADIPDDRSIKSIKLEEHKPIVVQASVLNVLLDMSKASMDGEPADETGTTKMAAEASFGNLSVKSKGSQESYFIIKDSDSALGNVQNPESCGPVVNNQPLPIEFENDKPQTVVEKVKEELEKVKTLINIKRSPKRIESPRIKPEPKHRRESNSPLAPEVNIAAKDANDTKYILDMLSHLTESRISRDFTPKDEEEVVPIQLDGKLAVANKTEPVVRRSVVPDRKSLVRSREDLLKDISMAQAILEFKDDEEEDNELEESADETTEIQEEISPARSARISNEVVKTLRFDDEVDESLRIVDTPLKKIAFANSDSAQLADSKTKVIPEYMSYVSDLKGLMNDLVKPMADIDKVPTGPRKCASTCSTQIQANLITSSQIDLVTEPDSSESIVPRQDLTATTVGKSVEFNDEQLISELPPLRPRSPDNRVLLFDHNNPLNNVLLPAIDASEVHPYDPRTSAISLNVSQKSNTTLKSDTQNDLESRVVLHNLVLPSGDASPGLMSVNHSVDSTRLSSVDQSIDAGKVDLKDCVVNTVIAMKRNHELLNASSSLTLVDDLMQSGDESNSPSPTERSRVKVIFKGEDESSDITDDLNSADDDASTQAKKRLYSPANREKKHCTFAMDVTPKPAAKVQKVSDSPSERRKSVLANSPNNGSSTQKQLEDSTSICNTNASKKSPVRKSCSPVFKRSETAMTIHQLITKYNLDGNDKTTLAHQLLTALNGQSGKSENSLRSENSEACKSLEVVSDWECRRDLVSESGLSERSGSLARSGWRPELLNEMSSKNLVAQCDSGVNVINKIDVLPFMGTSECEWESRGADAWSVRLLRGRVRLLVRLEHRHDNATRTCVRADTRVRDACVQPVEYESDDPIAVLCVRFAAESMRQLVSRGCRRAGDVPPLLRRCAGVGRVALRWARAMHAARTHLAYTLTRDGHVSLKVANIPLRSVWEVTLRIELVSELEEAPTPLALDVSATRVVSECGVTAEELARALAPLPRDWGHAPRALWKIFKHLKHKTLDEDILII